MSDDGAAGALARAFQIALRNVPGLSGVYDGEPIQAADAYASLDIGPEIDWGHKSGAGAEIRVAVLIRCSGEAADRSRRLVTAARAQVEAIDPDLGDWRLVSLTPVRARTLREPGPKWTSLVEYRVRLLAG